MNLQPNQQANPIGPPTPAPIAPNLGYALCQIFLMIWTFYFQLK